MSTPAENLRKARALIAAGWIQGRALDGMGNYCALGALSEIVTKGRIVGVHHTAESQYLMAALPRDYLYGVPDWNDAPGRTQSEVLAAFDRAIELAEAES